MFCTVRYLADRHPDSFHFHYPIRRCGQPTPLPPSPPGAPGKQKPVLVFETLEPAWRDVVLDWVRWALVFS